MFFDTDLADLLWTRLKTFYENDTVKDEEGNAWKIKGLNDRFRLAKYDKGEALD